MHCLRTLINNSPNPLVAQNALRVVVEDNFSIISESVVIVTTSETELGKPDNDETVLAPSCMFDLVSICIFPSIARFGRIGTCKAGLATATISGSFELVSINGVTLWTAEVEGMSVEAPKTSGVLAMLSMIPSDCFGRWVESGTADAETSVTIELVSGRLEVDSGILKPVSGMGTFRRKREEGRVEVRNSGSLGEVSKKVPGILDEVSIAPNAPMSFEEDVDEMGNSGKFEEVSTIEPGNLVLMVSIKVRTGRRKVVLDIGKFRGVVEPPNSAGIGLFVLSWRARRIRDGATEEVRISDVIELVSSTGVGILVEKVSVIISGLFELTFSSWGFWEIWRATRDWDSCGMDSAWERPLSPPPRDMSILLRAPKTPLTTGLILVDDIKMGAGDVAKMSNHIFQGLQDNRNIRFTFTWTLNIVNFYIFELLFFILSY